MASRKARVLYNYDAADSDQVSIKQGQLVDVSGQQTDEGWILVKTKTKEGYVPASYLEEIEDKGAPPPKPPGKAKFSMPSTRKSLGERSAAPSHSETQTNRPPPAGGRGAGASSNSIFSGRKESDGSVLTPDSGYAIFSFYMEWFGVVAMFLSGLFAFMYGTITPATEGDLAMGFGGGAMLGASLLSLCITVGRDSINCLMESPALSRCALICCCMLSTGGGFPIAALGDGALCFAAMANLLAYFRNGNDAAVSSDNWSDYCTNCCVGDFSILRGVFIVLFIAADVGIFLFGYTNGTVFALANSEGARNFLDPVSWGTAEGFGTIISFNIALLFFFSLFGFQKFLLDRAQETPNMCNNAIAWFVEPTAQIFLHTTVATSLIICVFCHMIANFAAFENSGAYRTYLTVFGIIPLITGMVAFGLLTLVMGGSHEDIKRNLPRLFRSTHMLAVALVVVLIFHGPNGLGRNFWKWIVGPLALYLVDVLFRAGWVSGGN